MSNYYYTIVTDGDPQAFSKEVSSFIGNGWYLYGVTFVKDNMFCQALLKLPPPPPPNFNPGKDTFGVVNRKH